jgi:RimJ/RimL family protein N-acetyltransferase
VKAIYLGTVAPFKAAIRFYEKNGFKEVTREALPASFPPMPLDHIFYAYSF